LCALVALIRLLGCGAVRAVRTMSGSRCVWPWATRQVLRGLSSHGVDRTMWRPGKNSRRVCAESRRGTVDARVPAGRPPPHDISRLGTEAKVVSTARPFGRNQKGRNSKLEGGLENHLQRTTFSRLARQRAVPQGRTGSHTAIDVQASPIGWGESGPSIMRGNRLARNILGDSVLPPRPDPFWFGVESDGRSG
jgi:hypothetical protein